MFPPPRRRRHRGWLSPVYYLMDSIQEMWWNIRHFFARVFDFRWLTRSTAGIVQYIWWGMKYPFQVIGWLLQQAWSIMTAWWQIRNFRYLVQGLPALIGIIFIMVITTLPAFTFQILDAYRSMSKDLFEMTMSFRPSGWTLFRVLIVPTIVPGILTAWKVNLGNAARVVVVAELVGATGGVGYQLLKTEEFDVRALAGPSVTKQFSENDFFVEALAGVEGIWTLSKVHSLSLSNYIYPALNDLGEFRNLTTFAWKWKLMEDPGLSLLAGVENEYQSKVESGLKHNDVKYSTSIGIDF